MNIEEIQEKVSALPSEQRRELITFMITLENRSHSDLAESRPKKSKPTQSDK
jgi:hypothetical protein